MPQVGSGATSGACRVLASRVLAKENAIVGEDVVRYGDFFTQWVGSNACRLEPCKDDGRTIQYRILFFFSCFGAILLL